MEMIVGLLIFVLVFWKDRKTLHFDLNVVQKFITLMILFTFARFTLLSVLSDFGLNIFDLNKGIETLSFWRLALVFWEDAFFALPIYYMVDKWKWSKYIWMPIAAVLSIRFGLGHIYQFELAYIASLLIPYAVFYRMGRKYGFGTTMTCHILFDMFTIITFKLSPIVVL
jgi:hypothetical protein